MSTVIATHQPAGTNDGKRMCGIASYHGGQKFEMVANKDPTWEVVAASS